MQKTALFSAVFLFLVTLSLPLPAVSGEAGNPIVVPLWQAATEDLAAEFFRLKSEHDALIDKAAVIRSRMEEIVIELKKREAPPTARSRQLIIGNTIGIGPLVPNLLSGDPRTADPFYQVVDKAEKKLTACFAFDPVVDRVSGFVRLIIYLRIRVDGSVDGANVETSVSTTPTVEECVTGIFKQMTFPTRAERSLIELVLAYE
ncbi:hypothetical protein HYW18_03285 [Candidatus Uhrbacteria bacterium]|nr:hypothetical protein [Candidatus Uhrbacteria bacterium]